MLRFINRRIKPTIGRRNYAILAVFLLLLYNYRSIIQYAIQWRAYYTVPCNITYIKGGLRNDSQMKVIYGATVVNDITDTWKGRFDDFSGCKYNNCIMQYCHRHDKIEKADVVLFTFNRINRFSIPSPSSDVRRRQIWLVFGHESPGYRYNHWSQIVDGNFNGTVTYRLDSLVPVPYSMGVKRKHRLGNVINYAKGKTKGAFAYVSNCNSVGYDRLELMRTLSKYVNVDIYGDCTGILPCKRMDIECETKLHNQYRFFLSFENSLCKYYITEKFWFRLSSNGYFVPVALGGSSMREYEELSPPNSYVHFYNFSSVEKLGTYMKYLMENDEAYNRYHQWRLHYTTGGYSSTCRLCEVANMRNVPSMSHLTDWWQGEDNCRSIRFDSNDHYHLEKFKSDPVSWRQLYRRIIRFLRGK